MQVCGMFSLTLAVDQQIIQVHKQELIQSGVEHVVHEALEGAWGVTEPKGKHRELIESKTTQECRFGLMPRFYCHLVVPLLQVYARNDVGMVQTVKQVINSR